MLNHQLCNGDAYWVIDGLLTTDNGEKLRNTLVEYMVNYTRQNVMEISVVVKDMTVTRILKEEMISPISFLANTGGLLGLCIGLSTVSVFEIIYYTVKTVLSKLRIS